MKRVIIPSDSSEYIIGCVFSAESVKLLCELVQEYNGLTQPRPGIEYWLKASHADVCCVLDLEEVNILPPPGMSECDQSYVAVVGSKRSEGVMHILWFLT